MEQFLYAVSEPEIVPCVHVSCRRDAKEVEGIGGWVMNDGTIRRPLKRFAAGHAQLDDPKIIPWSDCWGGGSKVRLQG